MSDAAAAWALELEGVTKRYGARFANREVTMRVRRGSVHALVGENGAGKSTLLSIAYGEVRADAGALRVHGRAHELTRWSPKAALAAGLGMVHQHFRLAGQLTVAENVALGREPTTPAGLLDLPRVVGELRELGARYGLTVWPEGATDRLSVGEQQRVEIVKVLWRGADVLLLDEPTAVLSPPETKELLALLERLRDDGRTVILCTHRLGEVAAIADRVTVLRRGENAGELEGPEASPEAIARAMLGGAPPAARAFVAGTPGPVVLAAEALSVARPGAADAVAGVNLGVRAGEIVGVAGVEGNGQAELLLALAGLRAPRAGRIRLGGADVTRASVAARAARGLGHVPEDRHARGVVLAFTLAENLLLGRQREEGRLLDAVGLGERARKLLVEAGVEPPDPDAVMAALSGGNQQKVVVARELGRPGLVALLLGQPTRGVDVGAAAAIRARILEARARGVAILLVSSDLAELFELADRFVVMRAGKIAGELGRVEATTERLGALMTGAPHAGAAA